jgi:hypothetical protein
MSWVIYFLRILPATAEKLEVKTMAHTATRKKCFLKTFL